MWVRGGGGVLFENIPLSPIPSLLLLIDDSVMTANKMLQIAGKTPTLCLKVKITVVIPFVCYSTMTLLIQVFF